GTLQRSALAKGLTLHVDIAAGSDDALVGDPTRIRQILFNLVGNALKFTERGGVRVTASTARLDDRRTRVSLAVSDTGIGLDAQQRARLFQPFAQADSSTTRRVGGTGLGPSIRRRPVQLVGRHVAGGSTPARRRLPLPGPAGAAGPPRRFTAEHDAAAARSAGATDERVPPGGTAAGSGRRRPSDQSRGSGAAARPPGDRRRHRQ